jgi:spore coat polysaccharide biosynthesis predicted glycosyltransferase SpsG/CMP-N-acetylneuraminic acid synthetase
MDNKNGKVKVWYMVPARAGSKTIPKKNVRFLGGKPLISHSLTTISKIANRENIIVSTDDDDVVEIARPFSEIHYRSSANADDHATLDEVALEVAQHLQSEHQASEDDLFVTVQPTSPFMKSSTIEHAVETLKSENSDTVLTVKDDRHLRWTIKEGKAKPLFQKRVNRQLMDPVFTETGGVIATTIGFLLKNRTRVGDKISMIEVDEKEGLDIDTFADWALADYWTKKLKICIRVDGGRELGFGHLYRALAIAQNVNSHDVSFVVRTDDDFKRGKDFLQPHHYQITEVNSNQHFLEIIPGIDPDLVINDILDTDTDYMQSLKDAGIFVVNFEDLGDGNRLADIVINDLYPDIYPKDNHWYGVEHAILNPNFEMLTPKAEPAGDVSEVLIAYGGSDPSNLTEKALKALGEIEYGGNVTVVVGPGHLNIEKIQILADGFDFKARVLLNVKNMAALMKKSDLALTSAGRTVTELMSIGVPTIAMCQNLREMRHNHASSSFGIVNLGMGKSITPDVLGEHIEMFLSDINLRIDMYNRMMKAIRNRSNHAVVSKILNTYENSRLPVKGY